MEREIVLCESSFGVVDTVSWSLVVKGVVSSVYTDSGDELVKVIHLLSEHEVIVTISVW